MNGQPVWLASASLLGRDGYPLPSEAWFGADSERRRVEKALHRAVDGVGDLSRQRLFRMPVTLCLHRALSDEEVAGLPDDGITVEHLAGAPLEVIWETVEGSPSTQPCHNPGRRALDPARPKLYLIVECGECPTCLARAAS